MSTTQFIKVKSPNEIFNESGSYTKDDILGVYLLVGKNGNENRYDLMGVPKKDNSYDFTLHDFNQNIHMPFLYVELKEPNLSGGMQKKSNLSKKTKKNLNTKN